MCVCTYVHEHLDVCAFENVCILAMCFVWLFACPDGNESLLKRVHIFYISNCIQMYALFFSLKSAVSDQTSKAFQL